MFEGAHITASIPARWPLNPSYMHTFGLYPISILQYHQVSFVCILGITTNYYIIVEQPLCVSFTGLLAAKWKNQPAASCLKWYDDECVSAFQVLVSLTFN